MGVNLDIVQVPRLIVYVRRNVLQRRRRRRRRQALAQEIELLSEVSRSIAITGPYTSKFPSLWQIALV